MVHHFFFGLLILKRTEAEVGISIKGEKDQSGRHLWRGTFADFVPMHSLVSFLCFVEEVRNRTLLHSIL